MMDIAPEKLSPQNAATAMAIAHIAAAIIADNPTLGEKIIKQLEFVLSVENPAELKGQVFHDRTSDNLKQICWAVLLCLGTWGKNQEN